MMKMANTGSPLKASDVLLRSKKNWKPRSFLFFVLTFSIGCCVALNLYFGHVTSGLHDVEKLMIQSHQMIYKDHVVHNVEKVSSEQWQRKQKTERKQKEEDEEEEKDAEEQAPQEEQQEHQEEPRYERTIHKTGNTSLLAELNCLPFGGPIDRDAAQEMVYWKDIPADTTYQSPFYRYNNRKENRDAGKLFYMTFEPDGGGWNNARMAMETILGLAIATGRTLVLPPEQAMYLLRNGRKMQKTDFSFQDFFPMHEIAQEQQGLHIITMEQFLEREALTGHLRNKYTGLVEFPPHNNRTNWNGQDIVPLKEWLRNVTFTPMWPTGQCMAAFTATTDPSDLITLQTLLSKMDEKRNPHKQVFNDNPPPVNGSTYDRLKDNMSGRKEFCLYNSTLQQERVLHFMCYHKMRVRYLTNFYHFLFFQKWQDDLWLKRFIRDHVRYVDEIQCAAARIVQALRQKARQITRGQSAQFDSFHIRRGDFQFTDSRIEATQIYDHVREVLPGNTNKNGTTTTTVVFIATDEKNKGFFDPLRRHYEIFFLDDFKDLLTNVNTNFYGMIDQLVASRGRFFFGCWHSTFTGYIVRIRGYHSQNAKLPGWEQGLLPNTFYYVPKEHLKIMHHYSPLYGAAFNREFPTSWRNLDYSYGF